jgi:hypothetical protein
MTAPIVNSVYQTNNSAITSGLGGVSVELNGIGDWSTLSALNFGPVPAVSFEVSAPSQAIAVAPSVLATSTVDVTITTTDGTSVPNPPYDQFTLLAVTPPYTCFMSYGWLMQPGGGTSGDYAGLLATVNTSAMVVDSNSISILQINTPTIPLTATDTLATSRTNLEEATLSYLLGEINDNQPPVVLVGLTANTISFVWI